MSTVVYKYRLWRPTKAAELVEATFRKAEEYYAELVGIENRRRAAYRDARSECSPDVCSLEAELALARHKLDTLYQESRDSKKKSRSRRVPPETASAIAEARQLVKETATLLKDAVARTSIVQHYLGKLASSPQLLQNPEVASASTRLTEARSLPKSSENTKLAKKLEMLLAETVRRISPDPECPAERLRSAADVADAKADAEVKALRKTLYWGTYLLLEDAWERAKRDEPGWLATSSLPPHRRRGRIGVQVQGGISRDELASCTDTRVQLAVPNIEHAGEKPSEVGLPTRVCKPRGIFRLRVGTVEGKREPVWAEFPVKFHRALPSDAVVKWAVVTRTPGHLYCPWKYHLCLTVETSEHARTVPGTRQEGTCAVNFGWRLEGGTLRVATLNNDAGSPEHVRLPKLICDRFEKCKDLQSIIDSNFEEAKKTLASWIATQTSLPPAFAESFSGLETWRSPRRLSELVDYWREHRLPGDDQVYAALWYWRGRWIHLYQWATCNRQRAIASRMDFYRNLAKRIATTSARVLVEDFQIPQVAKRAPADAAETGGRAARENRTRAAVGELRLCIAQACAKYHCELGLVKSSLNTRRCNVCGECREWNQSRELEHACPACGAVWDQDVNNTDNVHDRAASGEVVPLVRPANCPKPDEVEEEETSTFAAARGRLAKLAK